MYILKCGDRKVLRKSGDELRRAFWIRNAALYQSVSDPLNISGNGIYDRVNPIVTKNDAS